MPYKRPEHTHTHTYTQTNKKHITTEKSCSKIRSDHLSLLETNEFSQVGSDHNWITKEGRANIETSRQTRTARFE